MDLETTRLLFVLTLTIATFVVIRQFNKIKDLKDEIKFVKADLSIERGRANMAENKLLQRDMLAEKLTGSVVSMSERNLELTNKLTETLDQLKDLKQEVEAWKARSVT